MFDPATDGIDLLVPKGVLRKGTCQSHEGRDRHHLTDKTFKVSSPRVQSTDK